MTRVMVCGGAGMLGHKLCQRFAARFETLATVRRLDRHLLELPCFNGVEIVAGVEVDDASGLKAVLERFRPDVVVNAIGLIKQKAGRAETSGYESVNAKFPHLLSEMARGVGARYIGISTDCVFSGGRGGYREIDDPDAEDPYGRSKAMGEVSEGNSLTLRTSLIGRELKGRSGLVEWFLSNKGGSVRGFRNAVFSGFPTVAFADILTSIIEDHPQLSGLYHVSADPISKFDLLKLIGSHFDAGISVEEDVDLRIDRSLDSTRFRVATGFRPPPWDELIRHMRDDAAMYDSWRLNDFRG